MRDTRGSSAEECWRWGDNTVCRSSEEYPPSKRLPIRVSIPTKDEITEGLHKGKVGWEDEERD